MNKKSFGQKSDSPKDSRKPSKTFSDEKQGGYKPKAGDFKKEFKSSEKSSALTPAGRRADSKPFRRENKPEIKSTEKRPFSSPFNKDRKSNEGGYAPKFNKEGSKFNSDFKKGPSEPKSNSYHKEKKEVFDRNSRTESKPYSENRGAKFNDSPKPWVKNEKSEFKDSSSKTGKSSFERDSSEKRKRTLLKRDHPRPDFRNTDQTPPRFPSDRKTYSNKNEDRKSERFGDKPKFASELPRDFDNQKKFDSPKKEIDERQVGAKRQPTFDEEKMKKQLPPKVLKKVEAVKSKYETIRLNRYIANSGLCSRREADDFISSGQITVNGKTITEMGYQVQGSDVVKYGRKILNREKLVYVLLNKPKDFLTTTEDPEGRKTVMDLVSKACEERIYPIGRLDRATTGLLLLTNDGELADKLSHPSNNIKKIYQAEIDKPITQADFDKILEGVELEDGLVKADDLSLITPDAEVIGIEIHSGKNRIVRRIFEHLGYEVTKLDRTTYAGLTKKDLPRGNWRFLTEKEVIRLKYLI